MQILVVEDNPRIAGFLKKGLTEEGYTVKTAENGEQGLELARSGDFQAAVVDVMLPVKSGVDMLQALRADGSALPVLLLTARDRLEDKIAGLDAGADDYLTKPFDFSELTARLRALLRRAAQPAPSVSRAGELELDSATRIVRRHGEPVNLTPKEYALLEYLMRHPDRPLSRSTLMQEVWDIHFDPGTNLVDVFINSLRNKLDPERQHIRTVRGTGYMFATDADDA